MSDVELDGNNQLDLDSVHNEDDLDLSQISSLIQRIELALHKNFSGPELFQNQSQLENNNLLHSSSPVEFFKLFITDDFVPKMAEQTNFYAGQRGVPRSFKPVYDGITNLYLYINIHIDSG